MTRRGDLRWGCWPHDDDLLLLRAVLDIDDEAAAVAWKDVRSHINFDQPSEEQYRLLPLLAHRLRLIAPDDPLLGLLRGVARRHAIHGLLSLRAIAAPVRALREADIEPVLLKGPALALTVYDHIDLRPFGDADLLVHPDQHRDAMRVLIERGWHDPGNDFTGNHAVSLRGPEITVDLHRTLSRELVAPGDHASAWTTLAICPTMLRLPDGTTVRTLRTEDHLVHAIVHGTQRHGRSLRWVADASHLIRHGAPDWDRVIRLAEGFRVAPVVHDGLTFVAGLGAARVPDETFDRLQAVSTTALDRLRLSAFRSPIPTDGPLGGLPLTAATLLMRTRDRSLPHVAAATPTFLCEVWDVENARQLPSAVWRRAQRRGPRAGPPTV